MCVSVPACLCLLHMPSLYSSFFLMQQLFGCVYSAGSCYCLSRFSSMFQCSRACIRYVARQQQHVYIYAEARPSSACSRRVIIPSTSTSQAPCSRLSLFMKNEWFFFFLLLFQALSLSLSSSLHPHSRPLPYLEPAELLGWRDSGWKTSFVTSLHGAGVRTEVKSCRAELPGRLPETLLIRRPSFCKMFLFFCFMYS